MAIKKFLTSVADVYGYDNDDNLLFVAKTLLDSSIEVSLGSAPVRGGRGNQLLYTYYHTAEMKFNLTEAQWNLELLGATVGTDYQLGNYYVQETVPVTTSSGSVSGTPLAFTGTTLYGWATSPLGVTQRITFSSGSVPSFTVTGAETSGNWCVRYYTANLSAGKSITIKASMIPQVLKLVMETQLNSADVTTNKIGMVQIIVPRAQLSGAFTISMKADGVSNTPLTGTALSYTPVATGADACMVDSYYATITEIIDASNWYDNLLELSISGGDFSLGVGESKTLVVYAIPYSGASFKVPNSYLDFSSGSCATAGSHTGVVTGASAGIAIVSASATSASLVNGSVTVTVTA
jgi:hypothetical protein